MRLQHREMDQDIADRRIVAPPTKPNPRVTSNHLIVPLDVDARRRPTSSHVRRLPIPPHRDAAASSHACLASPSMLHVSTQFVCNCELHSDHAKSSDRSASSPAARRRSGAHRSKRMACAQHRARSASRAVGRSAVLARPGTDPLAPRKGQRGLARACRRSPARPPRASASSMPACAQRPGDPPRAKPAPRHRRSPCASA